MPVSARRIDGTHRVGALPGTTLVAIGNYDGVHRGHQAMVRAGARHAHAHELTPLVLTFHPHPHEVLSGRAHHVLTVLDRKVELLCRLDPRVRVVVTPFSTQLAELHPEEFVKRILVAELGAREVLVGGNFRFGRGREGDFATLQQLGTRFGFRARQAPLVEDDKGALSSTRTRVAIQQGDLPEAERVLGRPHALSGVVTPGDGRGRGLGFPTANLSEVSEVLPPDGVYAGVVDRVENDGTAVALARAVTNLGVRPTFAAGRSVEVHLLDFSGDLRGARLRLHLVERLREERRFADGNALAAQIAEDIAQGRASLATRRPDPAARGAWY